MRIKVLALTQNLNSGGGAEKFLANLTLGLKEDIDFILVSPVIKEATRKPFPYAGRLIQLEMGWDLDQGFSPGRILRLVSRLRKLSSVIQAEKPDLILSNFSYTWHLLILLLRSFGRVTSPILIRFGSSITHQLKNRDRFYGWFLSRLVGKADHFVANSRGLTQEIITRFSVDPTKCSTIFNPIPIERIIAMSNSSVVDISQEKKGKLVLVQAGRLSPEKNQELLIRVLGRLRDRLDVELWVIGSGPCEADLKQLADHLNISSSVRFWGWQDNPYPLLRCSDVFVLTSNYEGFPNVLIEAMALGCPVVATDCPYGPSEILEDGAWGSLTPVGDEERLYQSLLAILLNEDLRNQFSQRSFERAKFYAQETILPEYLRLFSSLAQKPQS